MKSAEIIRAAMATEVLQCFAAESMIWRRPGGWWVCWDRGRGQVERRYTVGRGRSHHPPWDRIWGHGGTACEALYQLMRWCRGQPVLPLSAWEYWGSDTIRLVDMSVAGKLLSDMDWPTQVDCVLCGTRIEKAQDWWDLDGVSGPLCTFGGVCIEYVPTEEEGDDHTD